MAQRLQVLSDDSELAEIRAQAARERMTVAEWVRQALRSARRAGAEPDVAHRLLAVREAAARYAFSASDVESMNAEIARGYVGDGSKETRYLSTATCRCT